MYLVQFLLGSDDETLEFQKTFPDTPHLGGVPLRPANGSHAPGGSDPPSSSSAPGFPPPELAPTPVPPPDP
eukprot:1574301-Prorocentrum_lima.AAC.1